MCPPLVAVPAYLFREHRVAHWSDEGVAVPRRYLDALHRAGAYDALLMPVAGVGERDGAARLQRFDGLLLIGGGDLDPSTYDETGDVNLYGVRAERDEFELALARAAVEQAVPTLAICRGHQVLNVALGGTLDQHITGRSGLLDHGVPGVEDGSRPHEVDVVAGSRLADATGSRRLVCASHHHQAIDRVGEGLRVSASAPDGIVEGVELDGDAWIVGVQWHPEDTAPDDPAQQALFDTFVSRCRPR